MPHEPSLGPTRRPSQLSRFWTEIDEVDRLILVEAGCSVIAVVLFLAGGFRRPMLRIYRQNWRLALPMLACHLVRAVAQIRRNRLYRLRRR